MEFIINMFIYLAIVTLAGVGLGAVFGMLVRR